MQEMPFVESEVISALKSYAWPGDVRELRNVLERPLILSRGKRLELEGCEFVRARTPSLKAKTNLSRYHSPTADP